MAINAYVYIMVYIFIILLKWYSSMYYAINYNVIYLFFNLNKYLLIYSVA